MTRKDFKALAVAIEHIREENDRETVAYKIGEVCARTNERFDWNRWLKACGVTEYQKS